TRVSAGARLWRARGRQGDGVGRAAAPRAADIRSRGGGRGHRPRHQQDPGGGGRAVTYTGGERRREVTSPVRARRRAVTPEVLKHVKGIELRARNLVNNLLTGDYRSVFLGHGIVVAVLCMA